MLKKIALISLPVIFLTGCSLEQVTQTASDAAACTALQGTLSGLNEAYVAGLVSTGVISQIDSLVGDQLDALLSSGLADDLRALGSALEQTNTGAATQQSVESLTASITERCEAVGVVIE